MVAQVEPDVRVSVDEGEVLGLQVPAAVLVVVVQVRGGGHFVEVAVGKGPGAPLLGVRDLQGAGDERGPRCRRDLVAAGFGAGRVEVGACGAV